LFDEESYVLKMRANHNEYEELAKVFRDYFAKTPARTFGDVLLDVQLGELPKTYPPLFEGLRKWQERKTLAKDEKMRAKAGAKRRAIVKKEIKKGKRS
jgi:hypothetical protein